MGEMRCAGKRLWSQSRRISPAATRCSSLTNDAQPVSLPEQWRGILGNSALFHEYAPELKTYLEQYPRGSLPGARDVFYWVKETTASSPFSPSSTA